MNSFSKISATHEELTHQSKVRYFYHNGGPEDNTPLQSQQEDPVPSIAPHEKATVETTLTASYPNDTTPIVDVAWTPAHTIDAEVPRMVGVYEWTSTKQPGDLLSILSGSDSVETLPTSNNPFCLPNHLFLSQPTSSLNGLNQSAQIGLFQALYSRHALYRSGFVVEVTANGTQFHGGSLLVVAIPMPHIWMASLTSSGAGVQKSWTIMELIQMNQLGIFPSVRLLPRNASAVRLELPYIGNAPQAETAAQDVMYAICLIVESQLSIPTGTAPTLTVTMRVGAKNAEFYGPKSYQQLISNLGTFRLPYDIPTPAVLEAPTRIATGEAAYINTSSRAAAQITPRGRSTETSYLPFRVEDWRSVLSRPTLMSLVQFKAATSVGTNIFQVSVCPTGEPITSRDTTQALPTGSVSRLSGIPYIRSFARYFSQWRGSLTYTFEYTGPAVSSGRILLAFLPGRMRASKPGQGGEYVETGAILQNFTENTHVVWDLANSTTVSITCPYSIATPWAPVAVNAFQGPPLTGGSSGTLVAIVMSPLVTPTVVAPTSDILVHISAGSDFEFRMPVPMPVNTIPMYNGVLDQGGANTELAQGEFKMSSLQDMDVRSFFSQSRFYGTFSGASGSTTSSMLTIPLSLITFAPSGSQAVPRTPEIPIRVFTGLFTFLRADLRITVAVPFSNNVIVTYRPPTLTPTSYSATGAGNPDSAASLLNGPSAIVSTRSSNMGIEIFVPYSSYASVFQTSWSQANRVDTTYNPNVNQVNPGDLGTLFVASRMGTANLVNVSVFIAFENVELFVPRPFPPTINTQWSGTRPQELTTRSDFAFEDEDCECQQCQAEHADYQYGIVDTVCQAVAPLVSQTPTADCLTVVHDPIVHATDIALKMVMGAVGAYALDYLGVRFFNRYFQAEREAHEMIEEEDHVREETIRASYQAPLHENKYDCPCLECVTWVEQMVDLFLDGLELDDGGVIKGELQARGKLPLYPNGITVEEATAIGWHVDDFMADNPDWELESLLGEITETEEIKAEEAREYFYEMPLSFPEGPDYEGNWVDGEFYRLLSPAEQTSPYPGFQVTPLSRPLLVYDPSPSAQNWHFYWNDTRRAAWMSSHGHHADALAFLVNHPARKICVPMKLAAEFISIRSLIEHRLSERWFEKDLAEVRAVAFTSPQKAESLLRTALRRVAWRGLSKWELEQYKKTTRFLVAVTPESEDDDFFEEEEESASYEAPLGLLPSPPSQTVPIRVTSRPVTSSASTTVEESEVDDEPPEAPYIYKVNRGTYVHWGLAYKDQAISLTQHGMDARVSLTNDDLKTAKKWKEVGHYEWFRAVCMLGQEFSDYSVHHNCTHFVEVITGEKLSNTGTYLTLGLAAAALATAFVFQSPKALTLEKRKLVAMEQQILDWCEPKLPKKTTRRVILRKQPEHRQHVFRRCMFFGKRVQLPRKQPESFFYEAPQPMFRMTVQNKTMEEQTQKAVHELQTTLRAYQDMAPQLSEAVAQAACSMKDTSMKISDFVDKLEGLVNSTVSFVPKSGEAITEAASSILGDVSRNIGCMILKIIGYVLIIFGNPNPATIAGVISLMAAEALSSKFLRERIRSVATSLSRKIQDLFLSLFKLSSCDDDPEIFEDIPFNVSYRDYMNERCTFEAPEPTLTHTFNQTVLAMKNIDWIISKIKDLIDYAIMKLKGKKEQDPRDYISSRAQYIVKLFDDSVETGSCQGVNKQLLEKRMEETTEMLQYCVNHRLGQPAALLSKTLSNYRETQRKLNASSYSDRSEPVVVFIYGGPGCGKSILANVLASAYCKKHDLKFSEAVFTTPPGSQYFDGYTGQAVHIIDDFCQNTTGEDVKLFCQMVSTTRFSPPMASLEEKGCNYCSKLIIATSNLPNPQCNEIRVPQALERRCHFKVRAMAAEEFQTAGGTMDVKRALRKLGPKQHQCSSYFKSDCPFLNGSALKLRVLEQGDKKYQEVNVYDLFEMIEDELDRREDCQGDLRDIIYQAPISLNPFRPSDFVEGVVPTLCNHVDHLESADTCHRVYLRKDCTHWHKDFDSEEQKRQYMEGFYKMDLHQVLCRQPSVSLCPCDNPFCAKAIFLYKENGKPCKKSFDFRSKSALDYFLFCHGHECDLADPDTSFQSTCIKREKVVEETDKLRSSVLKLQKTCMISFALTALGTLASVIGGIVWLVRRNRTTEQAPYTGMPGQARERRPHVRPIPTKNIRYEGPLQQLPQIFPKIESNTFAINYYRDGKQLFSLTGLGIGGRTALANYHGFSRSDQVEIRGVRYNISDLQVHRIVRENNPTDLVVFTLPNGDEFKNIQRFFLSVKERIPRADCVMISRGEKMVCNFWARNICGRRTITVTAQDTHTDDTFSNVIKYDVPSMPGLCGAPLVSTNPSREVVLGIHFAGTGSTGLAVPIYKEDFMHFLEADLKPIVHPGNPTHVARKSDLKKSPCYGAFPVTHGPAALTTKDSRLKEGVDLDEVMFSKHKPDHQGWPTLRPAMSYVVKELMGKLGFHPDEKIKMWSLEDAINGRGVMDGIAMNQSPGYPYNTQGRSRRSFFVFEDGKWKPTKELEEEVQKALKDPSSFYFSTFLKDELRPLEKVRAGKTRLVDGDSLPRALAYRMVFGDLFEAMLRNHGAAIHSAVGCNPDTFWTVLFHEIGPAHYPYVFDLDYSCFDSTEPRVSFELMGEFFAPYFEIDVRPFFSAIGTSKHIYEGKAFEMIGGMPSGCVGTSMFNCVNNSAYIVSALLALKLSPEEMSWICYGDDVIIATHEENLSKRIADFYAKETPLVVTPASKSGDFPERSTIYEVTFLKRFFQPDSNYPELIHPYMPLDHLQQSVMWCTDGPFQAKVDSLCFLAFHAGGPAYRDYTSKVERAAREKGVDLICKPFEYLMAQWYANFM
ncbi:polyprotein [Avian megrivirus]|nr:polyprotein [Avian megrivirus]